MNKSTLKSFLFSITLLFFAQYSHAQCAVYDTITTTICAGDTFYFNGVAHTRSTGRILPSDTVVLSGGCDSITSLRLTVLRAVTHTINQAICTGSTYSFNGQPLTASGTYIDTLRGASVRGCDSTVTLNLVVGGAVTFVSAASICYGDSFLFSGTYLKTAGVYRDTIVLTGTCDSVSILNLTYLPMPTSINTQVFCQGSSYVFNGQTITAPGTYRDTLFFAASNGCDSIVRLNYFPTVSRLTVRATLCPNDTLSIPGGFYILGSMGSARYAPDTVIYSCTDSIFTYIITVDTPATPMISASGYMLSESLPGFASYQWMLGGNNLTGSIASSYTATQNGSYTVEATDSAGCSATSAPHTINTIFGVGISNVSENNKVRIYPNPNTGSFLLETADAIGTDAVVYDVLGNMISHISIVREKMPIDMNIPAGVYLIKVKDNGGTSIALKFTVSK